MKTKKTNMLQSAAADRRVASGVARVFGAPRRVIIMVAPNRSYKLQKVCLLNLILFGSTTENMFSADKQYFYFKIFISPPLGLWRPEVGSRLQYALAPAPYTTCVSPYARYTFILCICIVHYKQRMLQDNSVHVCIVLKFTSVICSNELKYRIKCKVKFL